MWSMKNALKRVFELLDLDKIWGNGATFSEKSQFLKKCLYVHKKPYDCLLTLDYQRGLIQILSELYKT